MITAYNSIEKKEHYHRVQHRFYLIIEIGFGLASTIYKIRIESISFEFKAIRLTLRPIFWQKYQVEKFYAHFWEEFYVLKIV